MRVIAGSAKGCALKPPEGRSTRPTTDRVKESLFAVIQFEIAGSRVLDLFAGSGALGIEALSRGATWAVFVDKDEKSTALVRENLTKARLLAKAEVQKKDYAAALRGFSQGFDIIFLDPPYAQGLYEDTLNRILQHECLNDGGVIIVEYETSRVFSVPKAYTVAKEKKYGNTSLAYIRKV
jgi:16S rRNA (guanine(966)-N(2))-methyltransferase RsmD